MPTNSTTAVKSSARGRAAPEGALSGVPPPRAPVWVGWTAALALIVLAAAAWVWMRRGALRTWKAFAQRIGGEFTAKNRFSPAFVSGSVRGRPFLLETALSYEDEAPYYHTCASMPLKNAANLILGLRRKSLLEEAQTRGQSTLTVGNELPANRLIDLDDPEFARRFFLVCNDAEFVTQLLTPEARRELSRYHDVEIYVRLERIEWRRAGEPADLRALQRLTDLLADMADEIESLPARRRTLSERLADEALIEKGV